MVRYLSSCKGVILLPFCLARIGFVIELMARRKILGFRGLARCELPDAVGRTQQAEPVRPIGQLHLEAHFGLLVNTHKLQKLSASRCLS